MNGPRPPHQTALLAALLAVVVAAASGCASAPRRHGVDGAILEYESGRFHAGHEKATAAMDRLGGRQRAEASYVAGLCAYRLDHVNEAELRFRQATETGDAVTVARARAMLGLIRLEQGRPEEAAELLEAAAAHLDGDDARRARDQAREAWRLAGVDPSTRLGHVGEAAGAAAGFALQAGAFRERHRAQAAAGRLETLARRYALGPVRVIPTEDRRTGVFYMVRVGHFPSRHDAARVRSDLGRDAFIVVPY